MTDDDMDTATAASSSIDDAGGSVNSSKNVVLGEQDAVSTHDASAKEVSSASVAQSPAEGTESPFAFPGDAHKLDPGHVRAERLAYCLLFGTITLLVLLSVNGVTLAMLWPPGKATLIVLAVSLVVLLGMGWVCLVLPKVLYERTRWQVTDQGFEIRSGLFWKSIHVIPHDRVQHTDVTQGPLQRRFGISTLTIYTAGTSHASVTLEGLAYSVACQVRDHLIALHGGHRGRATIVSGTPATSFPETASDTAKKGIASGDADD
ncbi:MAG: PH domain-containing protein [Planctomycetota bacterium]